ncbi:endoribonuclease Dicer homolog 3b-like isoform X2 [Asparagus officinalis]|uniref:endoribonuclease Dicer homolog 3b-like isoform X2 n=1 Tax=Asparagus officinalis TaxID=4686 RepID=UPI00098E0D87|nr:endoribonuclease Dicer homolog 3b-like isoform X2 [Asparagus officinalis]
MGADYDPYVFSVEEPRISDSAHVNYDYTVGAGTTKRRELHGTIHVRGLSGTWANEPSDITLNAYKMKFVCDQIDKDYCGFVLLIEATLDNDVIDQKIDLYLRKNRVVKAVVSHGGQVHLNANQVEKLKLFQELLFNGLFGKLFVGCKLQGTKREFLLRDRKGLLWSSSNMYLLLPVEPSSSDSLDSLSINWNGIDACVLVVEILRTVYSTNYIHSCPECLLTCSQSSCQPTYTGSDTLHMANKSANVNTVKDMVVLAIHTGRIYSVLDVMHDKSAESPFDRYKGRQPEFISFADYYSKKYNIELQHPGQPLLLVKQSYQPHNLLSSTVKCEDGSMMVERAHVHIPPELLADLSLSPNVLRSFYLLPSVMHRLSSMMLACQLCEYIGHNNCQISSELILEAITTLRCCENFSLERLELFGDSVLKYVVSCHLFLKNPTMHEGQLTEHRASAVCNSMLHKLGTSRSLQEYIRDSAFDPRRWVAPGQISLHPLPCSCGVDTFEVPLERVHLTEDTNTVLGRACDKGHRWMCSKTVADCVEALIGAYYIGGGLNASYSLMRWLGMDITIEPLLIQEAKRNASLCWCHSKTDEIDILESKLKYRFSVKGLLLEAITSPSHQDSRIDYSYQNHTGIDPGELTDLRSASVSNENFAQTTVKHNLQCHLQLASDALSQQITEYVCCISKIFEDKANVLPLDVPKGPKVLGDILESIAGAILIDTDIDLDKVWGVFEPLLSPVVTPDKLELPPLRELLELCSILGYPINMAYRNKGEMVVAELSLQLEDDLLVRCGCDAHRKAAKAQAALYLLKDLKERGISHAQQVPKKRKDGDSNGRSFCSASEVKIPTLLENDIIRTLSPFKKSVMGQTSYCEPSTISPVEENYGLDNLVTNVTNFRPDESVALPIKMEKGGPRNSLFDLCRILQWPMPRFDSTEEKFRKQISLNGVMGFNRYTSSITLHVPNSPAFHLEGEPRADKKSSRDSAALAMLRALEKMGFCVLTKL